jgi:hypothetical protein
VLARFGSCASHEENACIRVSREPLSPLVQKVPYLYQYPTSMLMVVAAMAASASAAVPFDQIAALNELFSSTGGERWTTCLNWGVGDPCANSWGCMYCSNGVMYVACNTAVQPSC